MSTKEIVDFIQNTEFEVVAFAGREPFYNDRTIKAIDGFDQLIEKGKQFRYGVVTNGTLLEPYINKLKAKNLDWIDISLDGNREIHDSIRGKGVYDKAINSLKQLVDNKIARYVGVSVCCHKGNYAVLPELFKMLSTDLEINNLALIPYVYGGNNEKDFIVSKDNFLDFFRDIITSEQLSSFPLCLLFDFEWFTLPFVQELYKQNLFSIDDLKLDKEQTPYILIRNGKTKIYLKFSMLEMNRFLLMPDGYLGTMHISQSSEYWKLAGCNIREQYPIKEILQNILKIQFEHINRNLKENNNCLISKCYRKM